MHQGRGLERLPRLLLGQLLRRQLAQLVVDQRQELLGGVRVALLDGGQDAGDITHDIALTSACALDVRWHCNRRVILKVSDDSTFSQA